MQNIKDIFQNVALSVRQCEQFPLDLLNTKNNNISIVYNSIRNVFETFYNVDYVTIPTSNYVKPNLERNILRYSIKNIEPVIIRSDSLIQRISALKTSLNRQFNYRRIKEIDYLIIPKLSNKSHEYIFGIDDRYNVIRTNDFGQKIIAISGKNNFIRTIRNKKEYGLGILDIKTCIAWTSLKHGFYYHPEAGEGFEVREVKFDTQRIIKRG